MQQEPQAEREPPAGGSGTLLSVRGLRTWFRGRRGAFAGRQPPVRAVDGVDLDIAGGETLGLVGESGCGKTTLGRTILGIEPATAGTVRFRGESVLGLSRAAWKRLRREMQMIFQDPYASLNPRMCIRDIVTEGPREHGMLDGPPAEAARELLREVGLDADALYRYPFEFSGGQRQRIGIARALALNPAFVVCDEAVSALDVSVRAQVLNLLIDLRERRGLAYLFISHDLGVVRHMAGRIAVMYLGRIVEIGPAVEVLDAPRHPYTEALRAAVPVPGRSRAAQRILLGGDPPSPAAPPSGCPFHPRCPRRMPVCAAEPPVLRRVGGVTVACHLYNARANGEAETGSPAFGSGSSATTDRGTRSWNGPRGTGGA